MTARGTIALDPQALDRLLPMHLWVARDGRILSAGRTLRKLTGPAPQHLDAMLTHGRDGGTHGLAGDLDGAAQRGDRLFLRLREPPQLGLRGHVVPASDRTWLLNLGFGIGLPQAIAAAGLTDADFTPPELALELLFMREAMQGVLGELSRFNDQLEAARDVAEAQAHSDPLTGLSNRRGLEAALRTALSLARTGDPAGRRTGFALASLDLDHFKAVNDRLGHAAGDRVLCHVAHVLREAIRGDDTAARLGGDEFVLILKGLEDVASLHRLGQRIIRGIEGALSDEAGDCGVSASLGIVLSRDYHDRSAERMMADADRALYRSKHEGRGRVTILTDGADGTAPPAAV